MRTLLVIGASALMLAACGHTQATTGGNNAPHTTILKSTKIPKNPSKIPKNPQTPTSPGPTTTVVTNSPAVIASDYVRAQWTVNWSDLVDKKTGIAEWAVLIKPYVTKALWAQIYQQQYSPTPFNPDVEPYRRWIAVHRMTFANILQSGVITEAGVTPTSQVEQVTFDIEKTGLDLPSTGETSGVQIEQLLMNKVNGQWLVAKQYQQLAG
jgi:hypothetical protein